MKKILSFALCVLLHLTQVYGDEASSDQSQKSAEAVSSPEDLSRAKRALDMRRLARGIQMLRLGKRSLPLLRLGKRTYSDDDVSLQDLLASLDSQYYDEEYPSFEEPLHARYRRSADPSRETVPDGTLLADSTGESSSSAVKRSVNDLDGPVGDFGAVDGYFDDEEAAMEKRPMGMLRLGKRPVGMLRLGKRPVGMLRLGKRPVGMLRLGKRPVGMLRLGKRDGADEDFVDSENVYDPYLDEEEDLSADKRPMGMLRLGKRPMGMLRLGKRPVGMLRLGKRPVGMLRLGKRQVPMLRLGKRAAE